MNSEKIGGANERPNEAYDAWANLDESEQQSEESIKDEYDTVVKSLSDTIEASGHEISKRQRGRIENTAKQLTSRDNVGASCGEIQLNWQAPVDGLEDIPQEIFDEYAANIALASIFRIGKHESSNNNGAFDGVITSIPKNKLTPIVVDFLSDANKWTNPGNKDFNIEVLPTSSFLTRYINGIEADTQYLESIGGRGIHHHGETGIIGFDRDGDAMYGDNSYDGFMIPIRNLMPDRYRDNRPDFKRKSYVLQKVASERIEGMRKKQEEFYRLPDVKAGYRAIELAMQEIVDNSYKQLTPDVISKIYYKLAESNDEDVKYAVVHSPTLPLELQKTLQQQDMENA